MAHKGPHEVADLLALGGDEQALDECGLLLSHALAFHTGDAYEGVIDVGEGERGGGHEGSDGRLCLEGDVAGVTIFVPETR
jgi:hypothetical protein